VNRLRTALQNAYSSVSFRQLTGQTRSIRHRRHPGGRRYSIAVEISFRRRGLRLGFRSWQGQLRQSPQGSRFCLSHFRLRRATSRSIGSRLVEGRSCANARFVSAIRLSVMAVAGNRRTTKIMTGFRFGAGAAICATRRSLYCPFLSALQPLQPHRPQPGAMALLCRALQLGSRGADSQRPPTRGRSVHPAPMVSKSGFLSATVFVLTPRHARSHPGVGYRQASDSGRPAAVPANCIPLFRSVLAFAPLKT
jgi:hypothetical protein